MTADFPTNNYYDLCQKSNLHLYLALVLSYFTHSIKVEICVAIPEIFVPIAVISAALAGTPLFDPPITTFVTVNAANCVVKFSSCVQRFCNKSFNDVPFV